MKASSTFLLSLLAALPCPLRADNFEMLYKNTALMKAVPAALAPVSAPAALKSVVKNEVSYENLVSAPVWRASGAALVKTDIREGFGAARHQGRRNMCSVFAASSLVEYLVWEKTGEKPDFSEEFLFYSAKLKFTDNPELQVYKTETGLAGYVAVDALRGGLVKETDWPFLPSLPAHTPVPPVLDADVALAPAGIYGKLLGHAFAPQAIRRGEIKDFLVNERRPVVMNLMLYMSNIDGKTGRISDPSEAQRKACFSAGTDCYGHVVLLTGYDPASGDFFFRNSWGASWGEAGYGRISGKYLMENCESCHYISRLPSFDAGSRAMVVNSSYGWSATLK